MYRTELLLSPILKGGLMRLSFFTVEIEYINYLREIDSRVPITLKTDNSKLRPLIGVVLEINDSKFYAPLSSPKPKHYSMKTGQDFIKINSGIYGVINLNNMIPVLDKYITEIDVNGINDIKYMNLLRNQLDWCNANRDFIIKKATKLYNTICSGNARAELENRCCNFKLLLTESKKYK